MLVRGMFLLFFAGLTGCAHRPTPDVAGGVAIVPGCPSQTDGRLSWCQWRRAVWAAHLYDIGAVSKFVTSGSAVHTPYVEADAVAEGMIALGVPPEAILRERKALHTDQNVAYTLRLLKSEHREPGPLLMASDRGQASGMCAMVKAWRSSFPDYPSCTVVPIDEKWTIHRMTEGLPRVATARVAGWTPLQEREDAIATETGIHRPSSFWVYTRNALLSPLGLSRPPA
ncbi:MAG: YdcF family protein [Myxococcales bacterium]|nr:YdcF family protein [Myxococcales bacterium]